MNLKIRNFLILGCFCMFGIQSGLSMIREMQEMMNECRTGGGFCINTMPPQPPPRRRNRNRMGRRRMGTRTRKGQRPKPSPKAMGAQHNVLPGGAKAAPPAAGAAAGAPAQGNMAYQPPMQEAPAQTTPGYTDPFSSFFGNFFGTGTGGGAAGGNAGGFDPFYSMMMFTRKKRQAANPPPMFEPGEEPRRMRGQSMYNYLGQHCRKTDFSIGCRNTGGICCYPHLK